MTQSSFVQIHALTSYSGVLLNRDDVGFAKRLPFGGAVRTRISSQCLKRHWRRFDGEDSLAAIGPAMSVRSRRTFEEYILKPLKAEGVPHAVASAVAEGLQAIVLGASQKNAVDSEASGDSDDGDVAGTGSRTGQVTVLGRPELDYVLSIAREIAKRDGATTKSVKDELKRRDTKDLKKNFKAMRHGSGLDAALFGRMVTGDILARCDAAIHVAHAFTVNEEAAENDYFAAVDDLQVLAGEDMGSGHIGSNELTSGLFYGYIVIDVPLLVSNLEGCKREDWHSVDRALAAEVVRRLIRIVATVTPGAKLGSTAPYSYAHFLGIEVGAAQPRTFANAFLRPVRSGGDSVTHAYQALAAHVKDLDAMYGAETTRRFAGLDLVGLLGDAVGARSNVGELTAWAADWIRA